MEDATPKFIKMDKWPTRSPDCNPIDHAMWDFLKEKIYREVEDKLTEQALMNRIIISWEKISIEEIRNSISA